MRRFTSILLACVMATGVSCNNGGYAKAKESVEAIASSMTVEQKLAQMIMPSMRTWNDKELTSLNSEITGALKKYDLSDNNLSFVDIV